MTTTNQKVTKSPEVLTPYMMTTTDGTEIESLHEDIEFDDLSEVDYDLDYTVQY